jgi:hypothetical protein
MRGPSSGAILCEVAERISAAERGNDLPGVLVALLGPGGESEAKPALFYRLIPEREFMKNKRSLIALAAAGGTAALVFGGSAVSTAFTSDVNQPVTASAANVVFGSGTVNATVSGLVPGGSQTLVVPVVNNSTTPVDLYLYRVCGADNDGPAVSGFNFTQSAAHNFGTCSYSDVTPTNTGNSGQVPELSDLTVSSPGTGLDGETLPTLVQGSDPTYGSNDGQGATLIEKNVPVGASQLKLTFSLAQGAGNDWNDLSLKIPMFLHMQDNNGTDANGFQPDTNS